MNEIKNNKPKRVRIYSINERVWVRTLHQIGEVKEINRANKEVVVQVGENKHALKFWEIDKLTLTPNVEVKVSKVKPNAILPTKREEDAGYDLYACVEPIEKNGEEVFEIHCPLHVPTLIPTGVAIALPSTHYFNTKHERGSTGKIGMATLSGVIDSGYRGEIFLNIMATKKAIVISSEYNTVIEKDDVIYYPYFKAIAQGTIDVVPTVEWEEISYEELQAIPSIRGTSKLGASGK